VAMKNRKILLPALFSIALIFSLILPASVLNMTSVIAQENVTPWNLEPVVPPSDIENVTWGLESYDETKESGHVVRFVCSAINATFEGGRISGYAGCNKYWGDYELKGNNLSITELYRTEMSCGEFVDKIEQAYLTALRDAQSYEIEGGKLRINCGNRLLVFNEGYSGTEMWHRAWWPMVAWWPWRIAAAAAVAGLVIFLVRRRRHD